jgi:hypothetical protein
MRVMGNQVLIFCGLFLTMKSLLLN